MITVAREKKETQCHLGSSLYENNRERQDAARGSYVHSHVWRSPVHKISTLKRLAVVDAKTVCLPQKQTLNPSSLIQPGRADDAE